MRNSERLAAVKRVVERDRIIINQSTALGGVINRIEKWPEIYQALAVLVGYQEDGEDIPGLIQPNSHSNYVADLIAQYPPDATEFHGELFNSLQGELDGFCENLSIVINTLEQMSPEPSGSSLTAQFNGILSIDEFQQAVTDLVKVADLLKIKNQVNEVWTDSGSTVFGFEIEPGLALAMFHAAMSGAGQLREFIASMTPEMIKNCFRLLSLIHEQTSGQPLPDEIINEDNLRPALAEFANGEVTVSLPEGINEEQINGLKAAIPVLSQMGEKGWKLTCSSPNIEGSQFTQSTLIIAGQVNIQVLPQPKDDTTN